MIRYGGDAGSRHRNSENEVLDWNQYPMLVIGRTTEEQPSQDADFNQRLYASSQKFFSRPACIVILN